MAWWWEKTKENEGEISKKTETWKLVEETWGADWVSPEEYKEKMKNEHK